MNLFSCDKEKEAFGSCSDNESHVDLGTSEFHRSEVLVCATHGSVYAVRKEDGSRLWSAKIRSTLVATVLSLFITDTDKLLVSGNGTTFCLDLFTGATLWKNNMPGFGIDEVSILCTPTRVLSPKAAAEEAPDAPPEYHEKEKPNSSVAIACARGKCMAIDMETGEELWRYDCPGGGFNLPVALVEPTTSHLAYIGCGRWLYCLDAVTGELQWSTKLSDAILGYSYMTLATPWSSRLAAEAHTGFCHQPTAQCIDLFRKRRN
ncbi:uncharacterized protein BYT42DRAFT_543351 [Radiomyces spectabilis]|uniref:uncharacterized protein n=1 Tax=Radiomyces spectabilis TaxID=64574 RepID=UPI00221EDDFB|nr:uncharacterized protein BYT42DRAFT_543351 [Radiomyces spectabilis]KAI8387965.1 hypothetical protein BYT42DRAFT_543351 [Radiomyces spectabilis]